MASDRGHQSGAPGCAGQPGRPPGAPPAVPASASSEHCSPPRLPAHCVRHILPRCASESHAAAMVVQLLNAMQLAQQALALRASVLCLLHGHLYLVTRAWPVCKVVPAQVDCGSQKRGPQPKQAAHCPYMPARFACCMAGLQLVMRIQPACNLQPARVGLKASECHSLN